jgi:hypothetical protein
MKRIIKVLVVSALMVVLMASTAVSPALADHHTNNTNNNGKGWGTDGYNGGCDDDTQNAKAEGWKWGKCTDINYKK